MNIKIVNQSEHSLPQYQTNGSSGVDIRANLDSTITLKPLQRTLISTGLFVEIPQGYEAQIRSRSGLAIKNGIFCLNSPGTVDSDYRGEIKVILMNLSEEDFFIKDGDRVAQMVICKIEIAEFTEVENINETKRGAGGFGHTGKK